MNIKSKTNNNAFCCYKILLLITLNISLFGFFCYVFFRTPGDLRLFKKYRVTTVAQAPVLN